MNADKIISEIIRIAKEKKAAILTFQAFNRASGITYSAVLRHFDRWSDACKAAGIQSAPRPSIVPNYGPSRDDCINDLRRVAHEVGSTTISTKDYKKAGKWPSLSPFRKHFTNWRGAIAAAGLSAHPNHIDPIPFETLCEEFITTANSLGRLPTIHELKRRTSRKIERFAKRFGGYAGYKREIAVRFKSNPSQFSVAPTGQVKELLLEVYAHSDSETDTTPIEVHRQGSTLRFRQFALAPTQEQDVVAIFNSVAADLDFEILANRVRFPDCFARRRNPGTRPSYVDCRIEFEYRSSDFRKHGHPTNGCDLIVCWEHDWKQCPIEVLELKNAIRRLDGWK